MSFICNNCQTRYPKWMGRCTFCNQWDTVEEVTQPVTSKSKTSGTGWVASPVSQIHSIEDGIRYQLSTSIFGDEGLASASTNFIYGEAGVGKSTFSLQLAFELQKYGKVHYISGEESLYQIKQRAIRLGLLMDNVHLGNTPQIEAVLAQIEADMPRFLILDSIQTFVTETGKSSAGSPSQMKDVASFIQREIKGRGVTVFVLGHETKDGKSAGPQTVNHTFDCVVSLSRNPVTDYRVFATRKNRFGSVSSEVYQMTKIGLQKINPVGLVSGEGQGFYSINMYGEIVEVVSLVDTSSDFTGLTVSGYDYNRTKILRTVLNMASVSTSQSEVFVEAFGESDDGIELAIVASLINSVIGGVKDKVGNTFFVGRVSLDGRVTPPSGIERRVETINRMSQDFRIIGNMSVGKNVTQIKNVNQLVTILAQLRK